MSEHIVDINWAYAPNPLDAETFNRNHQVKYSEQEQLQVSGAAEYKGDPNCADPEQLLPARSPVAICLLF